jgi:hypothetical protein
MRGGAALAVVGGVCSRGDTGGGNGCGVDERDVRQVGVPLAGRRGGGRFGDAVHRGSGVQQRASSPAGTSVAQPAIAVNEAMPAATAAGIGSTPASVPATVAAMAGRGGQMRTEIARLQRRLGITTVYVTHDQTEAMTLGDRACVLRKGIAEPPGTGPRRHLRTDPRTILRMSAERVTVSFDPAIARRVRQCGALRPGGASAYLAKLVRDDELREAGQRLAAWYAANPTYIEDALEEAATALDEAG